MAKTSSRRRFLAGAGAGASVLAGGGALGRAVPAAARSTEAASSEALTLRQRNLGTALAERPSRGASAFPNAHAVDLPVIQPSVETAAAVSPTSENSIMRMHEELKRALAKPISQRKWGMVIDLARCVGCSACTIACKAENHLPPGVVYRPVIEEEVGEYPNVSRRWLPRPCMQCDDPPCVPVCPVAATWKREDGIVVIDYNACIGCRYCMTACPYGARYFDFGENYSDGTPAVQPYEESPSPEYGKQWDRSDDGSPVGNVRKCQFCIHRLNAGMLPACVTTCIGNATFFGDLNDPESLVSELKSSPRVTRLKEDLGTQPKVYYLA